MIQSVVCNTLMVIGGLFFALAGLGILRMPDLYTRISATTKAATLGSAFLLLGVGVRFMQLDILVRALAIIVFLALTSPVSAHVIGRVAYHTGVALWEHSHVDEYGGGRRS
jgi:multicomponent Na+:H+ antiporter subunit G